MHKLNSLGMSLALLKSMAQKQVDERVSPTDVLLAIRERNRRMILIEYLRKVGLSDELDKFARQQDSKRS